ncbi:MAG: hypothetical protein U0930_26520 [Pirellulales bacterium]
MRLENAISNLALIQSRLQADEKVMCFRWLTSLLAGIVGIAAACLQPWWIDQPIRRPWAYLNYWTLIAACVGSVSALEIGYRYVWRSTPMRRRQTREALLDFAPCVVAAAIISYFLVAAQPQYSQLLPALWMLCFSLGLFGLRRKLPIASAYVAVYFFVAAVVSVRLVDTTYALSGWVMGLSFGVGQILLATVLYFGVKDVDHGS